jgi:hypothetical protein
LRAPGIAMPVGGADQEPRLAHAIVAPAAEQRGEFLGRELRPRSSSSDVARGREGGAECVPPVSGSSVSLNRPGDALGM